MQKRKSKIKNFILKSTTGFMAVLGTLSACAVDSESWIPTILCAVSMLWLGAFAYANEDRLSDFEEGDF